MICETYSAFSIKGKLKGIVNNKNVSR